MQLTILAQTTVIGTQTTNQVIKIIATSAATDTTVSAYTVVTFDAFVVAGEEVPHVYGGVHGGGEDGGVLPRYLLR